MKKVNKVIEIINLIVSKVIDLFKGQRMYTSREIKLTVDYAKTVSQAISDGNYNWAHDDVNYANFPDPPVMEGKKVEVVAKLFHFKRTILRQDAAYKMDEAGYRDANLMELLSLGIGCPRLKRRLFILAYGSIWSPSCRNEFLVPFIGKNEISRSWNSDAWGTRWRFLGIRKEA